MAFNEKQYDLWRVIRNLRSAEIFRRRLTQEDDADLLNQIGNYVERQRDKARDIANTLSEQEANHIGFCASIHDMFPGNKMWSAFSEYFHREIKSPEDR